MRGSEGEGSAPAGIDLGAARFGAVAGLALLVLLSLLQGLLGWFVTLPDLWEQASLWAAQGLSTLAAGIWAARRAEGSGLLHGALAGLSVALVIAAATGVRGALPEWSVLLTRCGLAAALGGLGGIAGLNAGGGFRR
jgi:putative membrane protein (TIGR04086 family)